MDTIKLSLVDGDYAVACQTRLQLPENQTADLTTFLREMAAELATGQTAVLEVEDAKGEPITFSVSHSA
jgi:hypothetical protein